MRGIVRFTSIETQFKDEHANLTNFTNNVLPNVEQEGPHQSQIPIPSFAFLF